MLVFLWKDPFLLDFPYKTEEQNSNKEFYESENLRKPSDTSLLCQIPDLGNFLVLLPAWALRNIKLSLVSLEYSWNFLQNNGKKEEFEWTVGQYNCKCLDKAKWKQLKFCLK